MRHHSRLLASLVASLVASLLLIAACGGTEAAPPVNTFLYAPSAYSQLNLAALLGDAVTVGLPYAGEARVYVGDVGGVGAQRIADFWVEFYKSCPIKAMQRNLERYAYGPGTFADSGSVQIITTADDTIRTTYRTHWKQRPADEGLPQIVFDSIALGPTQLRCK